VQAVHAHPDNSIRVTAGERTIYEKKMDLGPAEPFVDKFELASGVRYEDLNVTIRCKKGNVLMTYQPLVKHPPAPDLPAPRVAPEKAASIDELHMWGKGFYQDPFGEEAESYYREIMRRKPSDVRGNRALGLMALHRGQWDLAIERLERSLANDPLNEGFVNHYYIGLAALEKRDLDRARDEFTIASRVARLNTTALYHLAIVAMRDGNHRGAVRLLREAIDGGGVHPQLQSTLAVAFRKLGNPAAAAAARNKALSQDPLEFLAMLEQWKAGELSAAEIHRQFDRRAPFFVGSQLYVEGAALYGRLGAWDDAASILEEGVRHLSATGEVYPMVEYHLGSVYAKQGEKSKAKAAFASATRHDSDYVFPYRPLDIAALDAAVKSNPTDTRAWGYMGNALYYLRRYEDAERAWLRSVENDPRDPSVLRSLAFVDWALRQDVGRAIERLEKASAADPADARILLELDYFLDAAGKTARREQLLSEREATVRTRDELVLAWSRLLLRTGNYSKAVDLMDNRRFFARESRAQSHAVYAEAHYGIGESLLATGKPRQALEQFRMGMEYPDSLGEGAPANEVLTRAQYLTGQAQQAAGDTGAAREIWTKAVDTPARPDSESVVYQALALRKLGRARQAEELLLKLIEACRKSPRDSRTSGAVRNYVLSRAY
ncbi:MAG: tetratricopeptide repeat protein, partial [bacterium]|nr:tetratricopeptide repeat protein [bacterium]